MIKRRDKPTVSFEQAKEATRRAVFLNTGRYMTNDEAIKEGLAEVFRTCRSAALTAGALEGRSVAEIDAALNEICDADTDRLKQASEDEFRRFASESRDIVNNFLSIVLG